LFAPNLSNLAQRGSTNGITRSPDGGNNRSTTSPADNHSSHQLSSLRNEQSAQPFVTQSQQQMQGPRREASVNTMLQLQQQAQVQAAKATHRSMVTALSQQQQRGEEIERLRREIQIVQQQDQQRMIDSAIHSLLLRQSIMESSANNLLHNRESFATPGHSYESLYRTEFNNVLPQLHPGLMTRTLYAQVVNPTLRPCATGIYSIMNAAISGMNPDMRSSNSSFVPVCLPVVLAQPDADERWVSEFQRLLRQQIEVFEADDDTVMTHVRGRNKPVSFGQVGLRCKHCAYLPVSKRQKGSTYFPSNLSGVYQAAQNMSTTHIQCGLCDCMPESIKQQFVVLMNQNRLGSTNHGAGRSYWSKSASSFGLVDTEHHGIRFLPNLPVDAVIVHL
jgi:hypothetical protein